MAKQKGILQLSGKHGGAVYTKAKNGNDRIRSIPTGYKRNAALKRQSDGNAYVNSMASAIYAAAKYFAGTFIGPGIYTALLSSFRKGLGSHRVIGLAALKHMELNDKYCFKQMCPDPLVTLTPTKNALKIMLEIKQHPHKTSQWNCYYMQIGSITWNSIDNSCVYGEQVSEWIKANDALPLEYEFVFERPEQASEYLVTCRCVLGWNDHDAEFFPMQGMKIIAAGSLDAKAQQVLAEKYATDAQARNMPKERRVADERVRVKRKEKG